MPWAEGTSSTRGWSGGAKPGSVLRSGWTSPKPTMTGTACASYTKGRPKDTGPAIASASQGRATPTAKHGTAHAAGFGEHVDTNRTRGAVSTVRARANGNRVIWKASSAVSAKQGRANIAFPRA
eukprot:2599709-Prymnesium_polylepis.1